MLIDADDEEEKRICLEVRSVPYIHLWSSLSDWKRIDFEARERFEANKKQN